MPWTKARRDENDVIVGVLPTAFELRTNEDYLSVTWIQHFGGDLCDQVTEAVRATRQSMTCSPKSCYGLSSSAEIRSVATKTAMKVRMLVEPTVENPAHVAVRQLDFSSFLLRQYLASDAFTSFVRNSDIPP